MRGALDVVGMQESGRKGRQTDSFMALLALPLLAKNQAHTMGGKMIEMFELCNELNDISVRNGVKL